MIKFAKITEENFFEIISLKVTEEQKEYVASNVLSLAQAWLHYKSTRPFAIMNDEELVGFIMLDWDQLERVMVIWRLMIDVKFQNHGYGKQALALAIQMAKENDDIDLIALDYNLNNLVAKKMYESFGFTHTGKLDDDNEEIMLLKITDQPRVGITSPDEEDIEELVKQNWHNLTKETINQLLKDHELICGCLFGEIISLYYYNKLIINPVYEKYYKETMILCREYSVRKQAKWQID